MMACAGISSGTLTLSSSSSTPSSHCNDSWKLSKFPFYPSPASLLPSRSPACNCRCQLSAALPQNDLKFVLHDALDSSGQNTIHARAARDGFCSEIQKLSSIERETSISFYGGIDLARAALHIAAEDDSLISHSSVPLPVDDFIERLDNLSMDYCCHYSSSFSSSPEHFVQCLERYLYIDKGFQRTKARNLVEHRALYLHSVLTHRSGSASMLSLIYSEILKMLRMWGLLNFDVEIFFPHDSYSSPKGYHKQKSKESDQSHIMTSQSLLVEILKDLKHAFWPFQLNHTRSLFLRAAQAAHCSNGSNNTKESAVEIASAKAAQHRLQRGVWTSVHFGDMRRALSACERLILLKTDPKELRDYAVLLYHCGFYQESLHYLKLYMDTKKSTTLEQSSGSSSDMEEDVVEKLVVRLNLILMEGWSSHLDNRNFIFNNSEPW
ncbi:Uncharacterized protein Adt_17334 [Abeliophyllum distichum]|uniref:Protein SirB1 N-terminal domain-containing protein n=1 Tax=Abeliophyllum distichum TaxID=126358 RepID=A0ABD1TGI2_9LAMI